MTARSSSSAATRASRRRSATNCSTPTPYAFLDDAPLEERRTRAVPTRRTLSPDDVRDLAKLDPAAIAQVRSEAWPLVRNADELHDALTSLVTINANEAAPWQSWLAALARANRATQVTVESGSNQRSFWTTAENWPVLRAAYYGATCHPPVELPAKLEREVTSADATVALVRGRIEHSGPTTAGVLAAFSASTKLSCLPRSKLSKVAARSSVAISSSRQHRPKHRPSVGAIAGSWLASIASRSPGCGNRFKPSSPCLFALPHQVPSSLARESLGRRSRSARSDRPTARLRTARRRSGNSGSSPPASASTIRSGSISSSCRAKRFGVGSTRRAAKRTSAPAWRRSPAQCRSRCCCAKNSPACSRATTNSRAPPLRSTGEAVLAALKAHGALFFGELKSISGTLPSQLEETLRELSAAGLVTSDSFAAVRKIVDERKSVSRARQKSRRPVHTSTTPVGRWSLFPGPLSAATREAYLEAWARQLLKRWGVLFRDVLVREVNAPRWQDLLPVLRLLELRGELRGGRFVSGVAGEQYALPSAVDALREARRELEDGQPQDWTVISAADPINLFGVITTGTRIPATHRNALIVRGGQLVASRQAGVAEFYDTCDEATQWTMRRAMTLGRKPVDNTQLAQPAPRRLR